VATFFNHFWEKKKETPFTPPGGGAYFYHLGKETKA